MRVGISGVLVVLVLSLTACSGGAARPDVSTTSAGEQSSGGAASAPTTSAPVSAAGPAPCTLLTESEVAALLDGEAGAPTPTTVKSLPSCLWRGQGGSELQVLSADASLWSTQVPALVNTLLARPGLSTKFREQLEGRLKSMTASGDRLTAVQACATFTLIAEGIGLPPGATSAVSYVPTREDPDIMIGQRCTEGRFTSVAVGRSELVAGATAEAAMSDQVNRVHERASGG